MSLMTIRLRRNRRIKGASVRAHHHVAGNLLFYHTFKGGIGPQAHQNVVCNGVGYQRAGFLLTTSPIGESQVIHILALPKVRGLTGRPPNLSGRLAGCFLSYPKDASRIKKKRGYPVIRKHHPWTTLMKVNHKLGLIGVARRASQT